jgi:plastocyanin domain-containing protein
MVKTQKLVEITDELMEQVVKTFYPEKDIYKEDKDGQLRVKKQYGEVRTRIFTILKNDLNGG